MKPSQDSKIFCVVVACLFSIFVACWSIALRHTKNQQVGLNELPTITTSTESSESRHPLTLNEKQQIDNYLSSRQDIQNKYNFVFKNDLELDDELAGFFSTRNKDQLKNYILNSIDGDLNLRLVFEAYKKGWAEIGLMRHGSIQDDKGNNLLWYAIVTRDVEGIECLLSVGYDIDEKLKNGQTPRSLLNSQGLAYLVR